MTMGEFSIYDAEIISLYIKIFVFKEVYFYFVSRIYYMEEGK